MSDPQQFSNTSNPRFPSWVKSARSGGTDSCVYVSTAADGSGDVAVADSKAGPEAPVLVFNRAEWTAFLSGAQDGAFDSI
jgi:hypothetical protein